MSPLAMTMREVLSVPSISSLTGFRYCTVDVDDASVSSQDDRTIGRSRVVFTAESSVSSFAPIAMPGS
jgi:hypothetical protein